MGKISAFYVMPHPPIIIPEIGKGEEKKISLTAVACDGIAKEIANSKPNTIILITPHGPLFSDAIAISYAKNIIGDFAKFGVPELKQDVSIDLPVTKRIIKNATEQDIVCAVYSTQTASNYQLNFELDHGAMVPLYFINKHYQNYKLVHITYGMLPKLQLYKFGMCIKQAVESSDLEAVFIASGDLSHRLSNDGPYQFSEHGAIFDQQITNLLQLGDVTGVFNMSPKTVEQAGECGLRSFYIMLGAMNGNNIKGNLLSYQDTFGVGYGVMSFELNKSNENTYQLLIDEKKKTISNYSDADPYVRLARESLTNYLLHGKPIKLPTYITDEMRTQQRGVFVSLKKEGQLRGCIGTFLPTTDNIATEIVRNAIQAGIHDPRFSPVTIDELNDIDFSVDVLTEPTQTTKIQLDPKKYGVIVKKGSRAGLLLPDLDGINTVDHQLSIALQKAGIASDEDYLIEKFEVIRHK